MRRRIDYTIRSFTDPAEILAKAKTDPGKLSLGEFALAASTLEAGSPEWTSLWATASRCFPDRFCDHEDANANIGQSLRYEQRNAHQVLLPTNSLRYVSSSRLL